MAFILLCVGFIVLLKGANYFVSGACFIANAFNIPRMIIGITIIAFGTSLPELAVNVNASLSSSNNLALGNIIGSNIINTLLILGITSIIKPISINKETLKKEFPMLILCTSILIILPLNFFYKDSVRQLSRFDGLLLLGLFILFMRNLISSKSIDELTPSEPLIKNNKKIPYKKKKLLIKNAIITILGLIAIVMGSKLIVHESILIARYFGISERIIGLTVIALGTSLPELVTSITASLKNETEIALGNILGSNIFNILLILGITSCIKPLSIEINVFYDIIFLVLITIITYLFSLTKKNVSRYEGLILSSFYIAYVSYIL